MKLPFQPLVMKLILGALTVGVLSTQAQTTNNVNVNPALGWQGYENYFDIFGNYQGGGGVGNINNLRATFIPSLANPTRLLIQPPTNSFNLAGPGNNPNGSPARLYEENFYVDVSTAFADSWVRYTGNIESNSLAGSGDYSNAYCMVVIKEFVPPNYNFVGSTEVPATPGAFDITRYIQPGNICQYGFYYKGPNAGPNSPNANTQTVSVILGAVAPTPTATVIVDPSRTWSAFINYLTLGNGYVGGFGATPEQLPAAFIPSKDRNAKRIILGLNTSTYDPTNTSPFNLPQNTFNDPNGEASKNLELDYYVEPQGAYSNRVLTFTGTVESNSLPAGLTAYCVIKEFTSSYGYIGAQANPLPSSGTFSVTKLIAADHWCQYGFYIYGTNVAPNSPNTAMKVSIIVPTPLLLTAVRSGNNVNLYFPTHSGVVYKYQVQSRTDATTGTWTNVGAVVTGTGTSTVATVVDPFSASLTPKYYRVLAYDP